MGTKAKKLVDYVEEEWRHSDFHFHQFKTNLQGTDYPALVEKILVIPYLRPNLRKKDVQCLTITCILFFGNCNMHAMACMKSEENSQESFFSFYM